MFVFPLTLSNHVTLSLKRHSALRARNDESKINETRTREINKTLPRKLECTGRQEKQSGHLVTRIECYGKPRRHTDKEQEN